MSSNRRVVAVLAFAALLGAGCPSGDDDSSDDDGVDAAGVGDAGSFDAVPGDACVGEVTIEDLPACYRAATCDMFVRCFAIFTSAAECMAADLGVLDMRVEIQRLVDAVAAGRITFDGVAAGDCFAWVAGSECASLLGGGDGCGQMFVGNVGEGGACFLDTECAGGGDCVVDLLCDAQCCGGTCRAPASPGESCSDRSCVEGAYCVYTTDTADCQTGEAGSPCTGYWTCDPQFWCDTSAGTPGVCAADHAADSACTDDAQCPSPQVCVGDDVSGTGMCARVDTTGAVCDDACYGPLFCDVPGVELLGTCAPLPTLSESCTTSRQCAGLLLCDPDTWTCVDRLPLHAACGDANECQLGLVCTAELPGGVSPGICESPLADFQPCASDEQCVSHVCASGACAAYDDCYQ